MGQVSEFHPFVLVHRIFGPYQIWNFCVCWPACLCLWALDWLICFKEILVSTIKAFADHLWLDWFCTILVLRLSEPPHELLLLETFRLLSLPGLYFILQNGMWISILLSINEEFLEIFNQNSILKRREAFFGLLSDNFLTLICGWLQNEFPKSDLVCWNGRFCLKFVCFIDYVLF